MFVSKIIPFSAVCKNFYQRCTNMNYIHTTVVEGAAAAKTKASYVKCNIADLVIHHQRWLRV